MQIKQLPIVGAIIYYLFQYKYYWTCMKQKLVVFQSLHIFCYWETSYDNKPLGKEREEGKRDMMGKKDI